MPHTFHRALLVAALSLIATAGFTAESAPRASTATGEVVGVRAAGVEAFKGLPFAAPPVGDLRWRPPQPAARWSGIRDASRYGADCMQEPFPGDAAPLGETPAEDCLYLNVWRPAGARDGAKLPVMVWIYGGGFVNGGASPAVYDGSAFARQGVILASFNYRLAHFGFFAHPALSAEQKGGLLANYGLMDQLAAMTWVRDNIARFGGDPANVTVFGESAGGMSVHTLLTTPLAKGLFQRAIVESGAGRGGLRDRPLTGGDESAEGRGLAFGRKYGIEGNDAAALAKLRAVPAADIARGLHMMAMARDDTYVGGPVRDGRLVLGSPVELYAKGAFTRVPVIVGANDADFGGVEGGMIEPAREVARLIAAHGVPAWEYRFSYVAQSMRAEWKGAPHATEIPFVFDTVAARYADRLHADDAAMAKKAQAYWVAFAKTGRPEPANLPRWPRYDPAKDELLDFRNEGLVVAADPWRAPLDATRDRATKR